MTTGMGPANSREALSAVPSREPLVPRAPARERARRTLGPASK